MSYNPAFVSDESPLASTPGDGCGARSGAGIKLTSFKVSSAFGNPVQSTPASRSPSSASTSSSSMAAHDAGSLAASTTLTAASTTITTLGLHAAVECRDLCYEVGRIASQKKTILHSINVTVPEGSIYGLLGPSGCGKTTMLRCVVGRIKPKSGYVRVFGYHPNDTGSQIPGPAIGYMPQEISVYEDFTINETLTYFGKINKMKQDLIDARIEFLLSFLDLPDKHRLVASLSGGQKRRVSLASALVHSPPLLILDEPTVGVDPLLRQSIWKHLVTLAQREKITIVITTHYIEEARQANVVGLMRHGKLLAEDSPDSLMREHGLDSLEDVFLKLCISDSSRKAAQLVGLEIDMDAADVDSAAVTPQMEAKFRELEARRLAQQRQLDEGAASDDDHALVLLDANGLPIVKSSADRLVAKKKRQFPSIFLITDDKSKQQELELQTQQHSEQLQPSEAGQDDHLITVSIVSPSSGRGASTNGDTSTLGQPSPAASELSGATLPAADQEPASGEDHEVATATALRQRNTTATATGATATMAGHQSTEETRLRERALVAASPAADEALAPASDKQLQLPNHPAAHHKLRHHKLAPTPTNQPPSFVVNKHNLRSMVPGTKYAPKRESVSSWTKSFCAVTWKNYIRLKRNPPVLIFEFILPAVQVILFCLCIGGDPFDVPLAVVNDEVIPQASRYFLDAIDKNAIRQVPYANLSAAIESVRRGETWAAIHIPDRYTQFLRERLTNPADFTNETLTNGTINIYPDLTNLHLALAMENTFREAFLKFARDTLNMFGYDPEAAELPIRVEQPVYGTLKRNGYLEFMAPGVVISITYVMATGLTALAFILEKRDGLLERSSVSGVTTSQILLAHAAVQVLVMVIQIALVLAFTFVVFEIPSHGPFFWVILLILLQGCTGMAFGLLVSAVCQEENTAVMMLVGTFYTNLILAGIVWPVEAMPLWLRWFSYAQPQTLPTEALRNILSRGWGIGSQGVWIGFGVTIGWLVVYLFAAGLCMRYWK